MRRSFYFSEINKILLSPFPTGKRNKNKTKHSPGNPHGTLKKKCCTLGCIRQRFSRDKRSCTSNKRDKEISLLFDSHHFSNGPFHALWLSIFYHGSDNYDQRQLNNQLKRKRRQWNFVWVRLYFPIISDKLRLSFPCLRR